MTDVKVYDNGFDGNEWFVIASVCIGLLVVAILPRRFSRKTSVAFFLCGTTFGSFFDLTLGTLPVSYYDVGDSSNYELMDVVSLFMYGPYSYLFFYLYDLWRIQLRFSPLYILAWTLLSVGMERISTWVGEFHYNFGYGLPVSFVIYFIVQFLWIFIYYQVRQREEEEG